jgi:hypothetical protein
LIVNLPRKKGRKDKKNLSEEKINSKKKVNTRRKKRVSQEIELTVGEFIQSEMKLLFFSSENCRRRALESFVNGKFKRVVS